ncbi:NAD-dependent epimerase/dehydratase family protein [Sphaerisporangium krabiense]|uniref:dTDP-6-deoxy-L-talose 4-dehydrogenase [NAD(P)+] n=1 Tax=Sphaerisporangium krabiense TaxID=763782 RepID=A0A7W9DQK3_9ACTN|nr:NAD(P)-dependent oxidoreductase [Sphaerisporangium krabiense]MBB5627503.1 dTDP-6-deoxy-L-talose 4-dehydrogenase [NAD(P)+] [Sphaerisporangium krabiense]
MDTVLGRPMTARRLRVAVLGGTGFVGRRVGTAFETLGHEVTRVARHALPQDDAPPVRVLDLARPDVGPIADALRDIACDVIVNTAGGMWGLRDDQMAPANLTLVENVLAAASTLPRPPRLVHLGSVHEYGLVPVGVSISEDDEARPVNTYAQVKLDCTHAVTKASAQGIVDGVTLRAGNITGAGQPAASLLGVVAESLAAASRDGRTAVVRMRSLGALRDFLNLSDAVSAIVAAATISELPGRVVNVGTGRATSARDMVRTLIEVSGVPAELVEEEPDAAQSTWQQMRIDLARRYLGWSPRHDLIDGIKELWEDHMDPGGS